MASQDISPTWKGRRSFDPYDVPPEIVPKGMSYQWCAKTILGEPNPSWQQMVDAGWWPVPGGRHPGMWKTNADGDVEIGGQMLMWRMAHETQAAREKELDAVAKQTDDWAKRYVGFAGGVGMQVQTATGVSPLYIRRIGEPELDEKIIDGPSKLPRDADVKQIASPAPKCIGRLARFMRWLKGLWK